MSNYTYLSAAQLAQRIPFSKRYIAEVMKDSVFEQGVHYIRPFGGRKVIYLWEPIEELLLTHKDQASAGIPMAGGGLCYG
jgi:hypothetical protein